MKYVIPVVIILLALLGTGSIYTVNQGHAAIVTRFGRIEASRVEPGLHFRLPFVQHVVMYDTRMIVLQSEPDDCKTRDDQQVRVGFFARWEVADPAVFYAATAGDALQANQQIASVIRAALCKEITGLDLPDLLTAGEGHIDAGLLAGAPHAELGKRLGVTVLNVDVEQVLPSEDLLALVYKRMSIDAQGRADTARVQGEAAAAAIRATGAVADQQTLAAADKAAAVARGAGDAEAAGIYAAASVRAPEFFKYWSNLETWRKSFSGGGAVVVLDRGSPFMQAVDAGAAVDDGAPKKR